MNQVVAFPHEVIVFCFATFWLTFPSSLLTGKLSVLVYVSGSIFKMAIQYRSWQNVFFWGGGGATWPSETYGGPGEKTLKIFEIFIPEIAANAPNFKN